MAIATGRVVKVIALDSATDAEVARLVDDVPRADLVMMLTRAGAEAHAAAIIGEACSRAEVMTMALVVRGAATTEQALSKTLAQVRPWSLMVVVASDEVYAEDILKSFR
jgi:hypothetical protein